MIKTIITFLFVFCVIVIIHELGHFIFAKRAGILVREFAIGMGPKIFSHQGKDGTTYTVRMIPMGGYVRMAGMGEEVVSLSPGQPLSVGLNDQNIVTTINTSQKVQLPNSVPLAVTSYDLEEKLEITGYLNGDDRQEVTYQVDHDASIIEEDGTKVRIAPKDVQFQSAKLSQRMMTNFAGPLFNFILTLVIYALILFIQGGTMQPDPSAVIGSVVKDGAADQAGIKPEDRITAIAGKPVNTFEAVGKELTKHKDQEVTIDIERDGKEQSVQMTPKEVTQEDGTKKVMIGIMSGAKFTKLSFFEKIKAALIQTLVGATAIFVALKDLIMGFSLNKLGGPVMIFQVSSQVAEQGFITVLNFMAMLSINLGIMNLLPIPALDGGKLMMNFYEGIRRKPLSPENEGKITIIGFAFVMILMILVTWNDIMRFFFR